MSLPSFPDKDNMPTREEAINQIISSIAMEELGLSHIINAEGEKLQYALGTLEGSSGPDVPLTMEELLKLNESITNTLNSNMMNQFFLKEKLTKALTASVMQGPTGPAGPQGPKGDIGPQGPTGLGLVIKGYYETESDRDDAFLPEGPKEGDVVVVAGKLQIFNGLNWIEVENLGGPTGPAWQPNDPVFTISDSTGTPVDMGYKGDLKFESETLDISVEAGPTVKVDIPTPHSSAIIPFASGKTLKITTEQLVLGGRREMAAIIGFGNGDVFQVPTDVTQSIKLTDSGGYPNHNAFIMSVDGKITSMAFYCSIYGISGFLGVTNKITARLYYSDTPDNVFKPIPNANIELELKDGVALGDMKYVSGTKELSLIPINAGERLLFLIDTFTPGYNAVTSITAHFGGSIKIE